MSNTETSVALRELAFRICVSDRKPAALQDAAMRETLLTEISSGVLIEEPIGIRFSSEVLMVQAAAQHMLQLEQDGPLENPKACFERLHKIFGNEIGKEEMVCGQVLAALHNTGKLDAFAWGRLAIEAGVGVFDVLNVLESAVPLFDSAKAESIFEFFCGHYEMVKNDLAQGMIYRKLDPWLAGHPEVAHGIKKLHELQPMERSGSLYGCTLTAIMSHEFVTGHDLTLTAAQSPESLIAGPSLHALGLVDYNDPPRRQALDQTIQLCTRVLRAVNHANLGAAVATLTRLVKFDEADTVPLLDEAGQLAAPHALYPLSVLLCIEEKSLRDRPWFLPLLMRLTAARAEHGGILRNIDHVLMGWVRDPKLLPRAMDFIHAWIGNQPADTFTKVGIADVFLSTIHRIAEIPRVLNKMLTSWLLHDDQRYPVLASRLISRLHTEGLTSVSLDSEMLDNLSEVDIRFLLRRMLGYLSGNEILIRLVFSLAHTRDAKTRTFGYVRSTYLQHVGYDYPHQTIEYLMVRSGDDRETDDIRRLADEIAKELQGLLDAANALPILKEFMPSSEKSKRFTKERHRQINEAFEEASKGSLWTQLATNIPLKAGRRTFQTIQGRYTDPMELKSMSHSVALPRSEIFDPAGSALERLLMQRAKRDAP
jgi:hypothetical protein